MQSRGNGVYRNKQSTFPEATRTIRGHDLFLGSLLFLIKKAPSGRFRINPWVNFELKTGRLTPDEKMIQTTTLVDSMLAGKIENTKIADAEFDIDLEDISDS